MAKFEKGKSGNPNGRPKGSQNKATAKVRDAVGKLVEGLLPTLENDLAQLEPKERVRAFVALAEYVLPKLNRTELAESVQVEIPKIVWDDSKGE